MERPRDEVAPLILLKISAATGGIMGRLFKYSTDCQAQTTIFMLSH
jgi:hypothetical protein